jgi:hypothetical protein
MTPPYALRFSSAARDSWHAALLKRSA